MCAFIQKIIRLKHLLLLQPKAAKPRGHPEQDNLNSKFHVEHVAYNITNQVFFLSNETKHIPSNQILVNLGRRGGTNSGAPKVQTNRFRGGVPRGTYGQKYHTSVPIHNILHHWGRFKPVPSSNQRLVNLDRRRVRPMNEMYWQSLPVGRRGGW